MHENERCATRRAHRAVATALCRRFGVGQKGRGGLDLTRGAGAQVRSWLRHTWHADAAAWLQLSRIADANREFVRAFDLPRVFTPTERRRYRAAATLRNKIDGTRTQPVEYHARGRSIALCRSAGR